MATVMLSLDGSVFAEQALPHALGRLGPSDELLLVRVLDPLPAIRDASLIGALTRNMTTEAEHYLTRLAGLLSERGFRVRTCVRRGLPREELPRVAAQEKVDLLVLASHGNGGFRRWVLGSVAQSVARRACCPVWLVPCQQHGLDLSEPWRLPPPPVKKILIPLDSSDFAERALDFLRGLKSAELLLLAALDTLPDTIYLLRRGEACEVLTQSLERYLGDQAARLRERGWQVKTLVKDAAAADAIIETAREESVDLIALTSHGRRGVERWLLGSVAERVLQGAHCPVALIPVRVAEDLEREVLDVAHS